MKARRRASVGLDEADAVDVLTVRPRRALAVTRPASLRKRRTRAAGSPRSTSPLPTAHYALVPIDPRDRSLYDAIENDNPCELRRLLAGGTPPMYHAETWSPLHHAVDAESDFHNQAGTPHDLRLIGPLIEAGGDVIELSRVGDDEPYTPLDLAIRYDNKVAIDAIVSAGGRQAQDLSD